MPLPVEPRDVIRELREIVALCMGLEQDYCYLYPTGFSSAQGERSEVRSTGVSDPTGELVASPDAQNARRLLRKMAEQIHAANSTMKGAVADCRSIERRDDWDERIAAKRLETTKELEKANKGRTRNLGILY